MILIVGGAYQGKLDFAKETFGITDSDVHICDTGEIDFSKRCIYKIEEFTYNHPDPIGYFDYKNKLSEERTAEWIREKQRTTYVRLNGDAKTEDFKFKGWVFYDDNK